MFLILKNCSFGRVEEARICRKWLEGIDWYQLFVALG